MLLLNIVGESVGCPLVRLHLIIVTLKGQHQGHSDFEGLYLAKKQSWIMCYQKTSVKNHIWGVQQQHHHI